MGGAARAPEGGHGPMTAAKPSARASLAVQPEALRALHGVGAVARAELAIERAGVLLDGVRREEQRGGDLAVGGAAGDQREDLALAVGERRRRAAGVPEHLLA